jgi:hypothetical protein
MAFISYVGRNGGSNAELEAQKVESLRLANRTARAKLQKLEGELVEKREVKLVIDHALTAMREHVLRLPFLICTELRELPHNQLHAIRLRVEKEVHRTLDELAETLVQAVNAPAFFAALDAEEGVVVDEDARARKKAAVNTKRRQKRASKQAKAAKAAS